MRTPLVALFLLAQVTPLYAQGEVSNPAPAKAPGLQEMFNQASEAWQDGDCAKALPLFETLSADARIKPGSLPAAAVALRRGDCMIRKTDAVLGETLIDGALPVLRAAGHEFDGEVATGEYQLGLAAYGRWDHDTTRAHLRAALALQTGTARLKALSKLAQVTAFDGGNEALDTAAEGLALVSADKSAQGLAAQSQWHALRGRILLNQGQVKAARAELEMAYNLSGGDKPQISLVEALLRADLGMAAMLDHDREAADKYTAMSGAGRVANAPFARAAVMNLPPCGPDTGLEPDDSAVVEFIIGDNGLVLGAQAIYSNGNFAKAAAFAKAVSKWGWRADDVRNIPQFFRVSSRVELRCTKGGEEGQNPLAMLAGRLMSAHGGTAVDWKIVSSEASAAQARQDIHGELVARTLLATHDLGPRDAARASVARGLSIAAQEPDVGIRNAARVLLSVEQLTMARGLRHSAPDRALINAEQQALFALAGEADIARDPLARDSALLEAAQRTFMGIWGDNTQAALIRVADDGELGAQHPLRQFALLRLAGIAAKQKDLAKAQSYFQSTGLNEEQCALLAPAPALSNSMGSSDDFPQDPLRYGFEGWVQSEFDITTTGRTANLRTIAAYPPFIFSQGAQQVFKKARFEPTYRPSNGTAPVTACSAHVSGVTFQVPGPHNSAQLVAQKPKKKT